MDIKKVEQLEREDPSEETLTLTNKRMKEIVKSVDYCLTNGTWRNYNPPNFLRTEIKRIENSIKDKTG